MEAGERDTAVEIPRCTHFRGRPRVYRSERAVPSAALKSQSAYHAKASQQSQRSIVTDDDIANGLAVAGKAFGNALKCCHRRTLLFTRRDRFAA